MELSIYTSDFTRDYSFEDAYRIIRETGFTAVDWSLPRAWRITITSRTGRMPDDCYMLKSLDEIKAYLKPEVDAIKKNGLRIGQSHAEIGVFFAHNKLFTDQCIQAYNNTIRVCEWVDCPYLIIHHWSRPLDDVLTYEQILARNTELFAGLIPVLKETGVKVCFENQGYANNMQCSLPFCNPYDAAQFIDKLNDMAGQECFAFCLDTGHLNLSRQTQRKFINVLGHRLKALHINDNCAVEDQHVGPRNGNVDWNEVIEGLRDVNYSGTLNFETCIMPYYEGLYKFGCEMRDRILNDR